MLDQAKKVVLSLSIVVLFALYAIQEKQPAPRPAPAVIGNAVPTATSSSARAAPTLMPTPTRAAATLVPNFLAPTSEVALAPTSTPVPAATAPTVVAAGSTSGPTTSAFRDGTYTGPEADANWGSVEVQVIISNGRINEVQFLDYPSDRNRSREINARAMPQLVQEAITSQDANVDIVSGATDTSEAYIESLTAALRQASA